MTTISVITVAIAKCKIYEEEHFVLASTAAIVDPPFADHTCHGDDGTNPLVVEESDSPWPLRQGDHGFSSNGLDCKERKSTVLARQLGQRRKIARNVGEPNSYPYQPVPAWNSTDSAIIVHLRIASRVSDLAPFWPHLPAGTV